MILTLDIETLPDQRDGAKEKFLADAKANFKAPSALTKEQAAIDLGLDDPAEIKALSKDAVIKRWELELADSKVGEVAGAAYRKTSFDATQGQICVIGWKINDEEVRAIDIGPPDAEKAMLAIFFAGVSELFSRKFGSKSELVLVGHNILDFDLRFLYQRAVILGVKPSFDLSPARFSNNAFDTMTRWAGYGNRISLDSLCKALDVPTPKDGMDGSQVYDYYKAGRIDEIAAYCQKDVEATYACYKKMTFQ